MAKAASIQFFHVFRFQVLLNGEAIPSESLIWEWAGDTLVLSRGMMEGRRPLMDEMFSALTHWDLAGRGILRAEEVPLDRKIEIRLETRERRESFAREASAVGTDVAEEIVGPKGLMLWRLEFDRIVNRGFLFMHAAESDVAREAVAFVGARLLRVRP
jgi:hypothetical protein